MKRLEGKIAIITGPLPESESQCIAFASEGASLGLIDINLDGGKESVRKSERMEEKRNFSGSMSAIRKR